MANNFIKFKGNKIGKSLVEHGSEKIIKEIYDNVDKNNCENYNTFDFAVSGSADGEANFKDLE